MTADMFFRSLRCVEKLSEILFRSEILTRSLLSKKLFDLCMFFPISLAF